MLTRLQEINKDYLVLGIAMLLGVVLCFYAFGFGDVLTFEKDDSTLYDINSTSEWEENSGILWTTSDSSFSDDRFRIRNYGVWSIYGYSSAANYRTSEINASGDPIELGSLNAKGYIGEGFNSSLRIIIYDCTKTQVRGGTDRLINTCYGDNEVYNSGLITDKGQVELNEDLSNITIDGYMHIGMEIGSNATETPEDPTYWSSLRLNREESKNKWEISNLF